MIVKGKTFKYIHNPCKFHATKNLPALFLIYFWILSSMLNIIILVTSSNLLSLPSDMILMNKNSPFYNKIYLTLI